MQIPVTTQSFIVSAISLANGAVYASTVVQVDASKAWLSLYEEMEKKQNKTGIMYFLTYVFNRKITLQWTIQQIPAAFKLAYIVETC